MIAAPAGWMAGRRLSLEVKAIVAILKAQQRHRRAVWHSARLLCVSYRGARGILSNTTDHRPASPGPEKSTARIYRFTLDWPSRIWTPINTFTALLMLLLGINKVTADKMRLRFSWQLGQRRAEPRETRWGWGGCIGDEHFVALQGGFLHTDQVFKVYIYCRTAGVSLETLSSR